MSKFDITAGNDIRWRKLYSHRSLNMGAIRVIMGNMEHCRYMQLLSDLQPDPVLYPVEILRFEHTPAGAIKVRALGDGNRLSPQGFLTQYSGIPDGWIPTFQAWTLETRIYLSFHVHSARVVHVHGLPTMEFETHRIDPID